MSEPVFKLTRVSGVPISDEELIADLRRVAEMLGIKYVAISQYEMHGEYSSKTQMDRFGTWNMALVRAGLKIYNAKTDRARIPELKLFENILTLWQHYGRQPRVRDLASAPSCIYTEKPYRLRFGSWMKALKAFVDYINSTDAETIERAIEEANETPIPTAAIKVIDETMESVENLIIVNSERSKGKQIFDKRGPRRPGRILEVQVLIRDKGVCQLCKRPLDNLKYHIDHIFPWIKGGQTILSNLQLLCSQCNLKKGDLDLTNLVEREGS
jgi:Homing endonuclease associated repeat/HNH endonuclease